jgi:sigma-B regulation protein RsbU (phosphoserine phosphatase)
VRSNKIIILTRKNLKEQKVKLDKELAQAADYVKTMLPSPISESPVYIDWLFVPSASLGGDAFGYNWLDDNHFAIYLLDVSGHGVGAALLSVSVLNVLRSQSLADTDFKSPNQVLDKLNMAFQGERHNDMFFTFWYGIYNVPTRTLTYASAGHPPALLFTSESNVTHLKTQNFVIGGMLDVAYEQKIQSVDIGASLYVFSDGVYEIEKGDGSMWSFREYVSLLSNINLDEHNSLENLHNQTLQISKGEAFEDDYTILRAKFI